jgi:hypothetical protein
MRKRLRGREGGRKGGRKEGVEQIKARFRVRMVRAGFIRTKV